MGFFDKVKSFVSGNAAKVTLEVGQGVAFPGETVAVRVTGIAQSDFESGGVYIDLLAREKVELTTQQGAQVNDTETTYSQEIMISGPFKLATGETRTFEGTVRLPPDVQPTYRGKGAKHDWEIRARFEARGNDPDSSFTTLRVGSR